MEKNLKRNCNRPESDRREAKEALSDERITNIKAGKTGEILADVGIDT
ncbi:MAG: hypothetical protein P8185_04715 [Deltaproteobacteria bacterium]